MNYLIAFNDDLLTIYNVTGIALVTPHKFRATFSDAAIQNTNGFVWGCMKNEQGKIIVYGDYSNFKTVSSVVDKTVIYSDDGSVGVELELSAISVRFGESRKLFATSDGTPAWASSDTSVATVDSDGIVTGTAAGTATITASYGGITAACTVTVA